MCQKQDWSKKELRLFSNIETLELSWSREKGQDVPYAPSACHGDILSTGKPVLFNSNIHIWMGWR